MVSWDKAKGNAGGKTEKREIQRLSLKGDVRIRLLGDVLPRYVYWVITTEGRKMPVECLRFMRESESFDDNQPDPMKEIDEAVYSDNPSFAYICNVLDRTDGQVKIFDLRATIYRQIVEYATNPEYGNPADPDSGYDITIKREKTGPLPQNVKYTCMPSRSSIPLTEEEKALELYELNKIYKRQTYDEQKEWILKNTSYFAALTGGETSVESVEDLD